MAAAWSHWRGHYGCGRCLRYRHPDQYCRLRGLVPVNIAGHCPRSGGGGRSRRRRRPTSDLRPQSIPPAKVTRGLLGEMPIERPVEKSQVVRALRSRRRRPNVVILYGAGGFGKSTLAEAVCLDASIYRRYSVVYRVRFREDQVSDFAIAGAVNEVVFDLTQSRFLDPDPESAGERLRRVLSQAGNVLLPIDDVWTERQLEPFLIGAKNCARLVTTRMSAILPASEATLVHVGPMSDDQACDLLLRGLEPGMVSELLEGTCWSRLLPRVPR